MSLILFGSNYQQDLLVSVYREGELQKPSRKYIPDALLRSGLIELVPRGRSQYIVLAPAHPAYSLLVAVLAELNGGMGQYPTLSPPSDREYAINSQRPLAHRSACLFRILLHVARSLVIGVSVLRRLMPDVYPDKVRDAVAQAILAGVLEETADGIIFAKSVPESYRALVIAIGERLAARDPYMAISEPVLPPRPGAFRRAADGAPRLFGSDIRLRNLMALAKHGPLYAGELRQLTGTFQVVGDSESVAMFGRGDIVYSWEDDRGNAYQIDPTFPLRLPLRRLLLKLEEAYPLPPLRRMHAPPEHSPAAQWNGDKVALFGGALATQILLTLGPTGWTFQSLCVDIASGYYRNVVEDAFATLIHEGVLEGDRDKRPGFDIRVTTIAESFVAREELLSLVRIAVSIWPEFSERVRLALSGLSSRTRSQLLSRGLLEPEPDPYSSESAREGRWNRKRLSAMVDYCTLAARRGRDLSNYDLRSIDPRLSRRIGAAWESFAAFRREVGLPEEWTGQALSPSPARRDACVHEYEYLSKQLGFLPNSGYLLKHQGWLLRRISAQWGGFNKFCDDVSIMPAGRKRRAAESEAEDREECRHGYRSIMERLGRRPTSADLLRHSSGLYKRISRCWSSFEEFCKDVGVDPPRRYADKTGPRSRWMPSEALRETCIREYGKLSTQLGTQPNSAYLHKHNRVLLNRIIVQWGAFSTFRNDVFAPRNDS
jgi:hypothetical protein